MRRVVILGAGGLAREVADVILACNAHGPQHYQLLGFIDENPANHGKALNGFRVLGDFSWFDAVDISQMYAVAGVGSPASKRKMVNKAAARGLRFCNLTHPTAVVTPFITLGVGVVITAGCILTNQITLGDHVFVNLSCTIGHDAVIDDFCNMNPGVHVSGNIRLEPGCDVGTGAAIIQGLTIGHWSIVQDASFP